MRTIDIHSAARNITVSIIVSKETFRLIGKGQINFSDLVAISTVETLKPVPGEVHEINGRLFVSSQEGFFHTSYHISVKITDQEQVVLKTDEESFFRVYAAFSRSIIDHKVVDMKSITIGKWFFQTAPELV